MQENQIHNYAPISEEEYADLKFNPAKSNTYYDQDFLRDRGVGKFDIMMDNLVSGVDAFVKLGSYASNPFSAFQTKELDWMPEYNSGMEKIVSVAKQDPVKFTKAVAQGALESTWNLMTNPEVVIPEYISNLSNAVKDQFTKSIGDYLVQIYGPEVTIDNATDEQLTEARAAMLFRTLEAAEVLGITAAAPKVVKAVAMGGVDTVQSGIDFLKYSAPKVKQNILDIAEGLQNSADEAMGFVPVRIDSNNRNNTAGNNDKIPAHIQAMLLPATSVDIKTKTGSMYKPSGWGSRQTYPQAKLRIQNYFDDLEDKFNYDFEQNFTEDFKKLSIFHQEETLKFLNSIWRKDGWTIGPNNQLYTEIADNIATFKANDFIKGTFANIENPNIWKFILEKAQRPFDPGPQPVAKKNVSTDKYSFNYYDVDGNLTSHATFHDPAMFKLGELLDHKELFKAYPEFKNLKIRFFSNKEMLSNKYENTRGYFQYGTTNDDFVGINYNAFVGKTPEEYMPTLLHEIQHAIEHRSGVSYAGKNIIQSHLRKKLDLINKNLDNIKPYIEDPSLIAKHSVFMGGKPEQVKAFIQGTEQGNYNIIFLAPGDIKDKFESAKFNLQLTLAQDHFITKGYDPNEWREIGLQTAEDLLKIQLYETKALLGSKQMNYIQPATTYSKGVKNDINVFGDTFTKKTNQEMAGGDPQYINPEVFFNRINQLVFKSQKALNQTTAGDIFDYGKIDPSGNPLPAGTSPIPELGLNLKPDFFVSYYSQLNEVMSKITDSSFKMTQSERQRILPYERIGVEGGEVVRQKGLFGVPYADEVSTARDISLAELVYYVNDKKLATKELENIHSSIVESIKKSDIMKNHFLPYMTKAAYDANMSTDQAAKYYNDWVSGFADSLLFTRNNPHVTMGTNVGYALHKKIKNDGTAKTFTDGLRDFGMPETADIIMNLQQGFIKKYKQDAQMNPEISDFDLFTQLDEVWRSTRIKPEDIKNITPEYDDISDVTGLSTSQNYVGESITIDGKKIGGF